MRSLFPKEKKKEPYGKNLDKTRVDVIETERWTKAM